MPDRLDQPADLTELERQRSQLYRDLAEVGDFRRGSLHEVLRRCGKANCACAQPGHPGHGPQYNFTRSVAAKTVNVHLKPGPGLDKIEREVAKYEHFRGLVGQVTEVNDAICEARPPFAAGRRGAPSQGGRRKRGLFSQLQGDFASEVERLATLAANLLGDEAGAEGLAALELAIRTAMAKLGGSLLEGLLAADTGHRGQRIDCGAGHQAQFVSEREKTIDTVLGPISLNRAYYHCSDCHAGVVPKDTALGVGGASLSPGLRAMTDRVGTAAPFAKAADLLAELAGITLGAKRIERTAEADGAALVALADKEADAMAAGRVVPLTRTEAPRSST